LIEIIKSIDELHDRLRAGKAVLLDARPDVEYQAGHLPQAISIPLDELERRLKDQPSVDYTYDVP
jgi:rhodanese-related sulfurtransferase